MGISVSEDSPVSMFRVEDYSSIVKMGQYIGNDLPDYTAPHPRRQ
jgi:hypothetical protein